MPGGAPGPFQFSPIQFSQQQQPTVGQQMQDLGKNLAAASKSMKGTGMPTPAAVDPGTAIQGGQGPIVAGGPQGPAPLPGQQALPGSPYSPQAGPPAPPPGAQPPPPGPPMNLVPNQPQGGAQVPMPQPRPPQAPPSAAPLMAGGQGSPVSAMLSQMSPQQQMAFFQRVAGAGQGGGQGSIPGGAGLMGMMQPGMMPSWGA